MGLDMYLEAETYVSSYGERDKELIESIKKSNSHGLEDFEPCSITYKLGYWRKANAIHGWFVKNVQDNVDDCGRYSVSVDDLNKLKKDCEAALDDTEKAKVLLPTTRGFFFGGYEYDEDYKQDLQHTISLVDKVLSNPESNNWEIFYRASW